MISNWCSILYACFVSFVKNIIQTKNNAVIEEVMSKSSNQHKCYIRKHTDTIND